jgi:hypothetical protein
MGPARGGWLVPGGLALLAVSCAAPREAEVPRVQVDTARAESLPQAEGWTGGDGCATLPLSGGRVLWLFSDSTIGRVEGGRHARGVRIVNNTVAVEVPGAGRAFRWTRSDPPGAAFTPADPSRWYWMAGGGFEDAGRLTLFVWEMGRAGRPGVWDFELRGNGVVEVDNPGETPDRWRWSARPILGPDGGAPGRRRSWGAAVLREGPWVYIYGADTTETKDKRVLVARAGVRGVGDPASWEFRTRNGWSRRAEEAWAGEAGAVDEFSVHRRPGGGFVLVQMEANLGRRVMARTAEHPEGPWSEGRVVYECGEPVQDERLMVYTARGHPEVSGPGGLTVSYCVNSRDFGQAMTDAAVYRPRFLVVPWALLAR